MTDSGTKDKSWKDVRIDNEEQARAFLLDELQERGNRGDLIWEVTKRDHTTSFIIRAGANDTGKDPAFYAHGHLSHTYSSLRIELFCVSSSLCGHETKEESYRNQDLSLIGLKALIGVAYAHLGDVYTIELLDVDEDGPRYWAHLGGFPDHGIFGVARELTHRIKTVDEKRFAELRGTPRHKKLEEALAIAEEYPATAFRALSQIPRAEDPWRYDEIDYVLERLFSATCKVGHEPKMVVDLKDFSTVKLLRIKLGTLPLCPAPGSFSQIAGENAKRNNDPGFHQRQDRYWDLLRRKREKYEHLHY